MLAYDKKSLTYGLVRHEKVKLIRDAFIYGNSYLYPGDNHCYVGCGNHQATHISYSNYDVDDFVQTLITIDERYRILLEIMGPDNLSEDLTISFIDPREHSIGLMAISVRTKELEFPRCRIHTNGAAAGIEIGGKEDKPFIKMLHDPNSIELLRAVLNDCLYRKIQLQRLRTLLSDVGEYHYLIPSDLLTGEELDQLVSQLDATATRVQPKK